MEADWKTELNTVVCHVLEQTAFLFPEPADLADGISFDGREYLSASLPFSGDHTGCVVLVMPVEMSRELAANLLGEDDDVDISPEKQYDAAKEILNIIVGQLLIQLYGDKALFDLTPPKVKGIGQEELFALIEQNEYALSVADDYPIVAIMNPVVTDHEHQSSRS